MGYASKQGRTRIDSRSPSASGQCDRCGFLYNHNHLRWQLDYSGAGLYNLRILVCQKCYDTPQQQRKVIVIPPDPMPILNARTPDYVNSETDYRATSGQNTTDPVTGIPIVQGNYRETNSTTPPVYDDNGNIVSYITPPATYERVTQQTGEPPYGLNRKPGTNFTVPGNSDPGLPYNNDFIPYTGPLEDE